MGNIDDPDDIIDLRNRFLEIMLTDSKWKNETIQSILLPCKEN